MKKNFTKILIFSLTFVVLIADNTICHENVTEQFGSSIQRTMARSLLYGNVGRACDEPHDTPGHLCKENVMETPQSKNREEDENPTGNIHLKYKITQIAAILSGWPVGRVWWLYDEVVLPWETSEEVD